MKILITGATGFVGKKLTTKLINSGHIVHVLTRDRQKAQTTFNNPDVTCFEWTNNLELPPLEAFAGINGVINLMGENIAAKKWSEEQKTILKQSRVDATINLVKAIELTQNSPLDFFISASAIGIYPVNKLQALDEDSELGHNYLAELCKLWEEATNGLTKTKRKVIIRTAVVLDKTGGALKKMLPPFQLGLGGPIGDGNQVMSWIHIDDLVNLYVCAANETVYNGIYNGAAPNPVNNFDFTKALGHALKRPTLFPVPQLPLKIVFGEMSSVILDSQKVISKKLPEVDFHFNYKTIDSALEAIFNRKMKSHDN